MSVLIEIDFLIPWSSIVYLMVSRIIVLQMSVSSSQEPVNVVSHIAKSKYVCRSSYLKRGVVLDDLRVHVSTAAL